MEFKRLCKCGCGNPVTKNSKGEWNYYLPSHNVKGGIKLTEQAEKERRNKISKTMRTFLANNEEAIQKRRDSWTGRRHTEESKQKMVLARLGKKQKPLTKEHKEKISRKLKGRIFSEETRQKITNANKGRKVSEQQKIAISNTLKQFFKENENPFKGRRHSEETKQKLREANQFRFRGSNGPNWQGGIASLPYANDWTPWKRLEIKIRDSFSCCNPKCKDPFPILDVHHIDYDKNNNENNNLITICRRCHGKTQRNRSFWTSYYQYIVKKLYG